ncbi:thioester domain-containing protein [Streptomyces sp. NPDC048659]|uniref:thioester domain-containing protein n=1 Tax=Streptomyces sp. NPDC048659 TaxID=3155489 RepID=UPI00343D707A
MVIGTLASGLLTCGAAVADTGAGAGAAGDGVLVVGSHTVRGGRIAHVTQSGGPGDEVSGGLIELRSDDGGPVFGYSLHVREELKDGTGYRVGARSDVPTLKGNRDAAKVDWTVRHGYPAVPKEDLGRTLGRELSEEGAAAGTQAAVWRLTDHVQAVPEDPAGAALADYLVAHAVDVPEYFPVLFLDPDTVTGAAGSLLGPLTLGTAGDRATAALDPAAVAAGVTLTDAEGKALSDASGKLTAPIRVEESLFVKVPADARQGGATISLAGLVPTTAGAKYIDTGGRSVPLILALGDIPYTNQAKATWTGGAEPSPTPTPTPTGTPTATPAPTPTVPATPSPSRSTAPPTTPATPTTPTGGTALASTGSSAVLGFILVAAGGLAGTGFLVLLLHEWRRRCRTEE